MPETSEDKRVSIRLSPQAAEAVEEIKKLGGFNTTGEAIRRAIGDELFLLRQKSEGWTVLLRKGNDFKEIVWP
jgi:hypothetical protein